MKERIEIIATIKRFDGATLNEEALAGIARVNLDSGLEAISWLLEQRYIYHHKRRYHLTEQGEEWLAQSGLYTEQKKSLKKWKDEALTGMVQRLSRKSRRMVSVRSTMDRAVLSTKTRDADYGTRPDQMLMEMENLMELRRALCLELDINMSQYENYLKEGRIRVCKYEGNHLGIFDRHSENKWQHICRRCRKKLRKQRNARKRFEKNSRDSSEFAEAIGTDAKTV